MALRFPDFSLLHQFIPKEGSAPLAGTTGEMGGSEHMPLPPAPELVSAWPPDGMVELALSNVTGLT